MKLFLCVDDEDGMAFMGRRVSRDRAVTDDIAAISGENLTVFPYSERLFKDAGYTSRIAEGDALDADCLFVENRSAAPFAERADTLVIYRWNRLYPSDLKIDFDPLSLGYSLVESVDIVGKSHEKVTREIYKR